MDRAIAYSSFGRIFQTFSGIVTILLLAYFFTPEEQGFYYTFGSLIGIQTFFELGFTGIITQFVAHEAAHLSINERGISGEPFYSSRLSSLLHFTIKWYSIAAVLFLIVEVALGVYFFSITPNPTQVSWFIPWILLSFATALKLVQSPFSSILLGLNKVVEINKLLFFQQILTPLSLWIAIIFNFGLCSLGISSLISAFVWFYCFKSEGFFSLLKRIYFLTGSHKVNYMREIFPYQWRIALSSLSGYFIFYFLTPMIFKYQGAVLAGKVGMAISVLSAIQAFSMSWLNTKVPLYSRLIAKKLYNELDSIFNKTMRQMLLVCAVLSIVALLIIIFIESYKISIFGVVVSDRFLIGIPLVYLTVAYYTQQFSFSWATYLRCHKEEPYLVISIVTGLACLISIYFTSKYTSINITMLSYMIIKLITLPWGYAIFVKYKRLWHERR